MTWCFQIQGTICEYERRVLILWELDQVDLDIDGSTCCRQAHTFIEHCLNDSTRYVLGFFMNNHGVDLWRISELLQVVTRDGKWEFSDSPRDRVSQVRIATLHREDRLQRQVFKYNQEVPSPKFLYFCHFARVASFCF